MSYVVRRTGGRIIGRYKTIAAARAAARDDWDRHGEQADVYRASEETMAGRRRSRRGSKRRGYRARKTSTKAAYKKGYKAGLRKARKTRSRSKRRSRRRRY